MASIYLFNLESPIISSCDNKWKTRHFPAGLGLIAGVLRYENHKIRVLDNYVNNFDIENIVDEVKKYRPDFLLFTGFLGNYQYGFLKNISQHLRQLCPHAIQIMGGPMATTIPELILNKFALNYVVLGEGEETILDLLDALQEAGPLPKSRELVFGIKMDRLS